MASEENVPFDPTSFEHIPVLLNECLEGLAIDPGRAECRGRQVVAAERCQHRPAGPFQVSRHRGHHSR